MPASTGCNAASAIFLDGRNWPEAEVVINGCLSPMPQQAHSGKKGGQSTFAATRANA